MTHGQDIYDETLASAYDAMFQNPLDETARVDFLAGITPEGGSYLDVGAGTGTIVRALADRGFDAVGVDNSVAMLRRLREIVAGSTASVIDADMFELDLGRTFDTVTLLTNTFYIATDQDRQLRLLAAVRDHLHEDSTLVVESFDPVRYHAEAKPPLAVRYLDDRRVVVDDFAVQHAMQLLVARHTFLGGGETEVRAHVIRYAFVSEMFLLARCSGLEVTGAYQDWNGTPYGPGAQRYILTMRVAK